MAKPTIVITGSRGLIGASLTKYLKKKSKVLELDLSLGHDLCDEGFVKRWFEENKADYLVNLFAINDHVDPKIERQNLFNIGLDSFRKFMDVNVVALFSVCREFAKNKESKGIVNFSSTYGLVSPLPFLYKNGEKHIGYPVSKGAVIQLTRHLATHLAPRVRVNCLVPGGVEHNQGREFIEMYSKYTPMKRMMKREELNRLVEFLCSEDSSYMTGSVVVIDGGWTSW